MKKDILELVATFPNCEEGKVVHQLPSYLEMGRFKYGLYDGFTSSPSTVSIFIIME